MGLRRWGRGRARAAALLVAGLACAWAAAWVGSGRHEELLSAALPLLLLLPDAPPPPPPPPTPPGPSAASSPSWSRPAFVLQPRAALCGRRAPFVLALVPSAPGHAAQRAAVRRTWGSGGGGAGGPLPLRTLFVLGLPASGGAQRRREQQAALEREARRHGDLIQARFADTYGNLTRKTLALLWWAASRCPGAAFVLKADDDVFVNVPALARHLEGLGAAARRRPLYLGRVHWRVRPARDPRSRHHVPAALYAPAAFPPYCSGTAYVLSAPAVPALLAAARHLPLVPVEDAFVGLCARRAGIAPAHLVRMAGATRFPDDACCYREVLFSVHGVAPQRMLDVWRRGPAYCTPLQRALGLLRCRLLAWWGAAPEEEEEEEEGAPN